MTMNIVDPSYCPHTKTRFARYIRFSDGVRVVRVHCRLCSFVWDGGMRPYVDQIPPWVSNAVHDHEMMLVISPNSKQGFIKVWER